MRNVCGVLIVLVLLVAGVRAGAQDDPWAAARADGVHILMRHASAPGVGDPDGFRLDDCSTQRNLDAGGREQARRIGEAIRNAGVEINLVLTSRWCRAAETARLLSLAPVEPEPALNSFFDDRSTSQRATADLSARLSAMGDRKAVLVTHQVNITALTGVSPASGEMVFVSITDSGDIQVRGRMAIR